MIKVDQKVSIQQCGLKSKRKCNLGNNPLSFWWCFSEGVLKGKTTSKVIQLLICTGYTFHYFPHLFTCCAVGCKRSISCNANQRFVMTFRDLHHCESKPLKSISEGLLIYISRSWEVTLFLNFSSKIHSEDHEWNCAKKNYWNYLKSSKGLWKLEKNTY